MTRKLRSWYLQIILSPGYRSIYRLYAEIRRLLTFRRHVIDVFLQLDDPYSYLLSHYLRYLATSYAVELRIHLSQALGGEFMPQPDRLAEYAVRDCRLLARELGIAFLDKGSAPVVEHRQALLELLAQVQEQDDFEKTLFTALSAYWRGDTKSTARIIGHLQPDFAQTDALIAASQSMLRKLGHYDSAMMYYAGEWYWGVDRLRYLCDRLDTLGLYRRNDRNQVPELASLYRALKLDLPATVPDCAKTLPMIEMYYSFRSPYSYLALQSAFAIADSYDVELRVRPVLPMVMRGLSVPRQKILYIVKDASREAQRLGIPFGKICDPLGDGAERCIAVFFHAQRQGKEREFMLSAGRAIWSEGIDVASDDGMRRVTERIGLSWPGVVAAMSSESWRETVQENRSALTEAGLWGVPSFTIGDLAVWGRDRDGLFARQIEYLCRGPG